MAPTHNPDFQLVMEQTVSDLGSAKDNISSVMDAVDDANDVDTTDDLENTQHCILNDENNSSQDSTMSNSQANNVEKAKDNVTPKKQFKSPTLAHVPSRKRRFDDSMVNEAYEAMKQTLAAKKPKDVFTICGEEVAVTLRNLPTTYAQAIVQHKISTLLFEAKLGNYNYPVAQQPQQQAPQAQHQHYYPLSQQYFLPPANSGGLLTILPPQQSPESYSLCSSGNPPTPALSTSTMTTDEDEAVDNFLTQLQTPRHHTSQ
ncbi:hypothetical protein RN001_005126 [Aquatica leii]|uniref:Uncharacterized protein n=1 Tax=Aquatica leii TaxID=1421715 RepID=A0AAN7SHR7_9COLE|nr:hypothetical protein RN001_005126 [Aquatica leii]